MWLKRNQGCRVLIFISSHKKLCTQDNFSLIVNCYTILERLTPDLSNGLSNVLVLQLVLKKWMKIFVQKSWCHPVIYSQKLNKIFYFSTFYNLLFWKGSLDLAVCMYYAGGISCHFTSNSSTHPCRKTVSPYQVKNFLQTQKPLFSQRVALRF